jgi:hypothetical protein
MFFTGQIRGRIICVAEWEILALMDQADVYFLSIYPGSSLFIQALRLNKYTALLLKRAVQLQAIMYLYHVIDAENWMIDRFF